MTDKIIPPVGQGGIVPTADTDPVSLADIATVPITSVILPEKLPGEQHEPGGMATAVSVLTELRTWQIRIGKDESANRARDRARNTHEHRNGEVREVETARSPQEYENLSPLCQFMSDLLLAGMSIQSVVECGYAFAQHESAQQLPAELHAAGQAFAVIPETEYMRHAAKQVKEASRRLGIDAFSQQDERYARSQH